MEDSCAPTEGCSRSSQKEIDELTAWLQGISETDDWRPYQGSNQVQQCSHPDRTIRVEPLVRSAEIEVSSISRRLRFPANQVFSQTRGRAAFLIRCRGPCSNSLKPTSLETFPGQLLTLYHGTEHAPTADGKPLTVGEWVTFTQPTKIHVTSGDTLLLFVTFKKR
jgi:hypothetical protein